MLRLDIRLWLAAGVFVTALPVPGRAQSMMDGLFGTPEQDQKPSLEAEVGFLLYESSYMDIVHDESSEDLWDNDLRAMLSGKIKGSSWKVQLSASANHTMQLGEKNFDSLAEVEPWESYAVWNSTHWDLSAGYQITRWGRGVVSLLDVVNPSDLRHGLTLPDEWSKRPVLQARYDYFFDSFALHGLYNPLYRESVLASTVSDWSPVHMSETQGIDQLPIFQQSVQQQVFPGIKDYPPDDFLHGELGLWVTTTLPGWDLGAYYFTGYDRIPLPQFSEDFLLYVRNSNESAIDILRDIQPQEVLLFNPLYEQRPERNHILSVDASTTLAGYVWRAELSFQPQVSLFRDDLEFLRPAQINALLGMDSMSSDSFVMSLNAVASATLVGRDITLLQTDRLNVGGVGAIRWMPGFAPLQLEVRAGGLVNDASVFAQPSVAWPFLEGHLLSAGVEIVEGQDDHIAGAFSHNDTWMLRYRYQLTAD